MDSAELTEIFRVPTVWDWVAEEQGFAPHRSYSSVTPAFEYGGVTLYIVASWGWGEYIGYVENREEFKDSDLRVLLGVDSQTFTADFEMNSFEETIIVTKVVEVDAWETDSEDFF